jgi:release factor glutamine methyltransferase
MPIMHRLNVIGLRILNKYLRRNKLLTRLIFGVRTLSNDDIHWDFTTIVLRKALKQGVSSNPRILEIGTGPYAILAIYLYRKGHSRIVANDINKDYVESALKTVACNGADLAVVHSDLFSNIAGDFDIILFNSVYIPYRKGKELMLNSVHQSEKHWCGGNAGTETIERFLKNAGAYLSRDGAIFLGFNPHYLSESRVRQIVKFNKYKVRRKVKCRFIPSTVLILKCHSI